MKKHGSAPASVAEVSRWGTAHFAWLSPEPDGAEREHAAAPRGNEPEGKLGRPEIFAFRERSTRQQSGERPSRHPPFARMIAPATRNFGIAGIVASVLGLTFAAYSSIDYAQHLDRKLHDVHCSLIPGLSERCRARKSLSSRDVQRLLGAFSRHLLGRDTDFRSLRWGPSRFSSRSRSTCSSQASALPLPRWRSSPRWGSRRFWSLR